MLPIINEADISSVQHKLTDQVKASILVIIKSLYCTVNLLNTLCLYFY